LESVTHATFNVSKLDRELWCNPWKDDSILINLRSVMKEHKEMTKAYTYEDQICITIPYVNKIKLQNKI